MKVYCAWCEREGRPAFIGEKAPFDDTSVTHGICADHERRLLMGLPIPPTATLLVVVHRDHPELYRQLLRLAAAIPGLHVILDRRRGERRWLHRVPVVENPPLARALYDQVEVGQEIPVPLYRAVAEVLAYVYRMLHGRSEARRREGGQ